jgi:flagellar biosynthesis protein FliR
LACGLPTLKPQHSSSKQNIVAGCLIVPFVLLMLALQLVHLLVALLQGSFAASE